ncbi:hypothetical protein TPHA_0J03140 [Tetrapisispora phaffii CBS 4417]|uniref:Peroxisomal membrane protein PEX16 n=1 Tax=Tetrapisispora phaffii (strain ATCC 24235 / CBS 4417 / NBRC 1672 / NRRL Y-8282 / UCD 70-5) TaxID=1071381 RepID=G8BY82_TETPH|nr:hypothetical protein TPHA_0J03140 [Tetrapisispora phaffii CBS 4417]CCE65133.1 hypothetical protein TPHA_0J03140 [Tetrapisispora phaffii CBS 4417]
MEDQNKYIRKLINYVCLDLGDGSTNKGKTLLLLGIRRLAKISALTTVLLLVKLRKQKISSSLLKEAFETHKVFSLLSLLYPVLTSITKKDKSRGLQLIPFETTVLVSLLNCRSNISTWLLSYVSTESIYDLINNLAVIKKWSKLDPNIVLSLKQIILSLIIPCIAKQHQADSTIYKLLFNKRSYIRDFIIFDSVWNFLSLYNIIKQRVQAYRHRKQFDNTDTTKGYAHNKNLHKRSKSSFSLNWKPLLDKLIENQDIYDITNKETIINKILNSFFVKNILPTLKWTIWRQSVYKIFASRDKKNKVSNIHSSVLIFFSFMILNGSNNDHHMDMNIRTGVIKYMLRSLLTVRLQKTDLLNRRMYNKIATFLIAQLAIYNYKH